MNCLMVQSALGCILMIFALILAAHLSSASILQITIENHSTIFSSHETLLVNFYADWCRFSQQLTPIITEAAIQADSEFKGESVAIGRIDCEISPDLCLKYKVNKYPTLKLFKFGQPISSEYRGARSVTAFIDYLREYVKPRIAVINSVEEADQTEYERRLIGFFPKLDKSSPEYYNFLKVSFLANDCKLFALERKDRPPSLYFSKKGNSEKLDANEQVLKSLHVLSQWAVSQCTPLVRELTFTNAEEITERGLPLLIFFYKSDDKGVAHRFSKLMEEHFFGERDNFMLLTADGIAFSHPLSHLGKSTSDLPIICIDSFQHMFIFADPIEQAFSDPKHIRDFIRDFHSGKLHRQFHGQPEPEMPRLDDGRKKVVQVGKTTPIESAFIKLTPADTRYTFLKEEL